MSDDVVHVFSNDDLRWRMVKSFLLRNGITSPQQLGYEHFMGVLLKEVIEEGSKIHTFCQDRKRRDEFYFDGVTVVRPQYEDSDGTRHDIDPNEALRRRITYECEVRVDVHHKTFTYAPDDEFMEGDDFETLHKVYRNIPLFYIPCMVRSRFCHWNDAADVDPSNMGAYFIIQGHEKAMIELQKMRTNYPVTRVTEWITQNRKKLPKRVEAEIRSASGKWRSTSTIRILCERVSGSRIRLFVHIPFVTRRASPLDVPLSALFRMLRVETVDDMLEYIFPDVSSENEELVAMVRRALEDTNVGTSREDILNWLVAEGSASCKERSYLKRRNYILHVLKSETLPHNGSGGVLYAQEIQANQEEQRQQRQQQPSQQGRWSGRLRQYHGRIYENDEIDAECMRKSVFIGFTTRRLVHIYNEDLAQDDRDHYSNKRLDTPGPLLAYHFRLNFRGFLRQLPSALQVATSSYRSVIDTIRAKAACLTSNMREPFKRGNWSMSPGVNTGVVQNVARLNPSSLAIMARKIMTPLKKEGKSPVPRQVHLSQESFVCCVETPEGQACGLMLVLCMFARVGLGIPTHITTHMLRVSVGPESPCPLLEDFTAGEIPDESMTIVLINGTVTGFTRRPARLERELMDMRRNGDLPNEMRFVWHREGNLRRYFHVNTDCSAAMRPVLCVDKLDQAAQIVRNRSVPLPRVWSLLERAGCIEYLDREEQDARRLLIAKRSVKLLSGRYTHLELDPTCILGLLGSIVPYSDHNQSPRNMYFTSQKKAGLSRPCFDTEARVDKDQYIMWYLQKPMVQTRAREFMVEQIGGITGGQTPIWAVCCLDGFNMEDSIYMKRQAIQRGMFQMYQIHTVYNEAKSRNNEEETFEIPPEDAVGKKGRADYSKLGPDGVVPIGTVVKSGDVLIGKVARLTDHFNSEGKQEDIVQDRSVVLKKVKHGVVHDVIYSSRERGNIIYVKVRTIREPERGDKFASNAAQKGTIGLIVDEWDLPFSAKNGITPDIVMNTHAIPSRMTIGMMLECVNGKATALDGKKRYADTFAARSPEEVKRVLLDRGFNCMGREKMICGKTGRTMQCQVFMGPVSYMRQSHMVHKKVHSRARGPRDILTRQPTEGRSRDGGIRCGEMERDALISHSAPFSLRDRLCENSDATPVPFCLDCGRIAEHPHSSRFGRGRHTQKPFCRACRKTNCVTMQVPFASNLLFRELEAMHITARVEVEVE